jgi:hypothetical protein
MLPISSADVTELDVLGYNLANQMPGAAPATANRPAGVAGTQIAAVPEPGALTLFSAALLGLGALRRCRRSA